MSGALSALPFFWPETWATPTFASEQEAVELMRAEASRIVSSQIALIAGGCRSAPAQRQIKTAVAIWRAAGVVEAMITREKVAGGV